MRWTPLGAPFAQAIPSRRRSRYLLTHEAEAPDDYNAKPAHFSLSREATVDRSCCPPFRGSVGVILVAGPRGEMTRTAVSVRLIAGAPVALVDHARAERPGLDQVQRDVFSERRQERRAATDDDRIAEHAQLVDEAELDRRRGQAGAADPDVLVGRVERRSGLLDHRRLGEPGVALDAVERAAEDDLRDRAPDIGERGVELAVAHRRIRLPHQHRLVEPAAQQKAPKLACLRDVETKQVLVGNRPGERALTVGDEAVHRDAHRVDQHGFKLIAPERRMMIAMKFTIELDIGLSYLLQA